MQSALLMISGSYRGMRAVTDKTMQGILLMLAAWPSVNSDCNYHQNLDVGKTYYAYPPSYPNNYEPGTSCQWSMVAPTDSQIKINCTMDLPYSTNCKTYLLLISATNTTGPKHRYCGMGSFTLMYNTNVTIALSVAATSKGGQMLCVIKATSTTPCDCGRKKLKKRIVGGKETGINEYPMMAGLVDSKARMIFCGATIISNRYVITAAHCVISISSQDIGIVVGEHDITQGGETQSTRLYRVQTIVIHQKHNTDTHQNDIAILSTTSNIAFSQEVRPACLPYKYKGANFAGAVVTALGWGLLEFAGTSSNKLMKVNLNVQSNEKCAQYHPDRLTNSQMCTFTSGKDSCQLVSGGPLLYEDSGRVYLAGIISYSNHGCAAETPTVNTRVTSYLGWIQRNTPDAIYCIK